MRTLGLLDVNHSCSSRNKHVLQTCMISYFSVNDDVFLALCMSSIWGGGGGCPCMVSVTFLH